MHRRFVPKAHRFSYRIFLAAFDLDEIDAIAARTPLFSRNRLNVFSYHDADHLTLPGLESCGTKANVIAWLAEQGVSLAADGSILLVTMPRVFGYVFNPISFYFCYDRDGRAICAIAEVHNTYHEQKLYLLRGGDGKEFRLVTLKQFYVSPFSPLDLSFEFCFRLPGSRLHILVNDRQGGVQTLVTSLTGRRAPLTSWRLAWFTIKYPLVTLRVIAAIHLNAALLWLKRVPWHRKAHHPDQQRGVLRPHASLSGKTR